MARSLRNDVVVLGLLMLLSSPAYGLALYSTLTETLYMDCVQHTGGTGPAYRVDMKFQAAGAQASSPKLELETPVQQVFIATNIVEMNDRSVCNLGLDPSFSFDGGMLDISIPLVDVVNNSGQQLLSGALNLHSNGTGVFSISNPRMFTPDNTPTDPRPGLIINNLSPLLQHGFGESYLGVCLNVRPSINVTGQINLDVQVAMTLGPPQPKTLIATTTVHISKGNTTVPGGLTTINRFGEYHAVPLLGEIPALGYLFKMKQQQSAQTELLILVGPAVIDCPQ